MTEPANPLIGRDAESALIMSALGSVVTGGRTLIVEGDAGVGKTALVAFATCQASRLGLDVLQLVAVEAEAEVPFAGLHQLLHPIEDRIEHLPAPQRRALRVAFGAEEGPPASLFLIALAALTMISERATGDGLVMVAEDIQWLDSASRTVLEFISRRLNSEPVILLATHRTHDPVAGSFAGGSVIFLRPLREQDASALLDQLPHPPAGRERRTVLEIAVGNPLALLELGATIRGESSTNPRGMSLPRRLEDAFAYRLRGVSDVSRFVLLVAAVSGQDAEVDILEAASLSLGRHVDRHVLDEAVERGLMHRHAGRLTFDHPLIRTATVQSATGDERTQAHRAVAMSLPEGSDRRVWHQALVAAEPDEHLAQALEAGAARAKMSNDTSVALSAFKRAAELSPSREDHARRLYLAAESALELARVEECLGLLADARESTRSSALRSRIAWLTELLPGGAIQRGSADTLLAIVDDINNSGQPELAISSLVTLALNIWGAQPEGDIWRVMIDRAAAIAVDPDDPRMLFLMASGTPGQNSRVVRDRLAGVDPRRFTKTEDLRLAGVALAIAGEPDASRAFLEPAVDALRREGRLTILSLTLSTVASNAFDKGDFAAALSAADESETLARETDEPFVGMASRAMSLLPRAVRGEDIHVQNLRDAYPTAAIALAYNPFVNMLRIADGLSCAAHGDHQAAYTHLLQVVDSNSTSYHWRWALMAFPYFADAAARTGHVAEGCQILKRTVRMSGLAESQVVSSALTFARGVLSGDADKERLLLVALDPQENSVPFLRGLAALSLGQWLRHVRRPADARVFLRASRDEFDRVEAATWSTVARSELLATGEASPRPRPSAGQQLTPQEDRIARLAADGLTNREIAAQLFLSPRTVGAHLYSLFPKLGVTSRIELADALHSEPNPH